MTDRPAPTDEEILDAVKHLGAAMLSPIEVAHALFAAFGTPPPAVAREPLTEAEIARIYERYGGEMVNCARAIERAHGIKQGGQHAD